jgi:hypothetical protein
MKFNWKAALAALLGLASARFIFYLARWNYNSFNDQFNFGKFVAEYGVPTVFMLIWLWIIQTAFKSRSK